MAATTKKQSTIKALQTGKKISKALVKHYTHPYGHKVKSSK